MGNLFVGFFLVVVTCINVLQEAITMQRSKSNQTLPESFLQSVNFYHIGVIIFGVYLISQTNVGAY